MSSDNEPRRESFQPLQAEEQEFNDTSGIKSLNTYLDIFMHNNDYNFFFPIFMIWYDGYYLKLIIMASNNMLSLDI